MSAGQSCESWRRKGDLVPPNQPILRMLLAEACGCGSTPETEISVVKAPSSRDLDGSDDVRRIGDADFVDRRFTPRRSSADERRHQVFGVRSDPRPEGASRRAWHGMVYFDRPGARNSSGADKEDSMTSISISKYHRKTWRLPLRTIWSSTLAAPPFASARSPRSIAPTCKWGAAKYSACSAPMDRARPLSSAPCVACCPWRRARRESWATTCRRIPNESATTSATCRRNSRSTPI